MSRSPLLQAPKESSYDRNFIVATVTSLHNNIVNQLNKNEHICPLLIQRQNATIRDKRNMTHTRTEHHHDSLNKSKEHPHCSKVHKNRPRDHFNLNLEQKQCSIITSKEHSNCSNTKILEQSDCSNYPISHRDHFHSSLEHQQRSIIKQMEHSDCSTQKFLEQSHRSNKQINHHYSGNLSGKSKECSIKSPNLEQRQHSIHNCYGAKVSVPNTDRSQTYT